MELVWECTLGVMACISYFTASTVERLDLAVIPHCLFRGDLESVDQPVDLAFGVLDRLAGFDAQRHGELLGTLGESCDTVVEHPLPPIDEIVEKVLPVYRERLAGKTFAVRCKRTGSHEFTSVEVERQLGGALLAETGAAGVKLRQPDVRVELEISKQTLFVIRHRYRGPGGYPVGAAAVSRIFGKKKRLRSAFFLL